MKLLGFNITRSPRSNAPTLTRSFSAAAWLKGEDTDLPSPVLSNAYQQVVWVYRSINVLAEQVANIPFLFSKGERGRETLITRGPLIDFYNRPHPHLNKFQYWEMRVIWLMLRGECFRVPIYSDASPGSLSANSGNHQRRVLRNVVFRDPAHMQHIIENNQLIGWRYTGSSFNSPMQSRVFLPDEVWFEKLPNPFDFWRGMPPLYVAQLPARTDFAASAFMQGLIENNADLGVIVKTDQQLTSEQQDEVLAALRNRKRKAGTADKPLLLSSGADVIKPTLSSADLQFLDNRKFSRGEICSAFGVPEEIVATTDHNKYDVMTGARRNFIENRIMPLCARLEAEEDRTVKSIDRTAVGWFDTDSLPIMQDIRRARIATAKTGFDMGIPLNELNRVYDLGFKNFPWGETAYVPSNSVPVGELPRKP